MEVTHTWNELLDRLEGKSVSGFEQVRSRCPVCNGGSFYAKRGHTKIILFCHSGCEYEDVLDALNLKPIDLYITKRKGKTKHWQYWQEQGEVDKTLLFLKKEWEKQGDTFTDEQQEEFRAAEARLTKYQR